ncbi:MAG TPA: hypothetical protein VNM14_01825 [Planctomycetota bacterium]|jgi:hypothetical protein|nr:hypothetical protein [Planctomycetota bacterium]
MSFFWNRRRPSLARRILGSLLFTVAAAGVSMAAEVLRRKLRIGSVEIEGVRHGRRTRVRATIRKPARRRKARILSSART